MSEQIHDTEPVDPKDVVIKSKIESQLFDTSKIDAIKMSVEVKDGHVTLKGKADTEAEKENAQLICASVDGVIKVDNQLIVEAGIIHSITSIVSRIVGDDDSKTDL